MNKRTQLRAGMIVTTTLITIFICMVFYCVVVVSRSYKQQKISEKMAELSFQLSLLQSEFVQFSGERPKSQWASVYASLQIILDDYPRSELSQTQELLFKEIREATMQQKNLFEELVRNVDEGGNATIIRELNNQLSVIAQTGTTNALELAELGRQQAEHATRWLSFVIVVLGLLVLGVSVGSYLLSDAIASSLLSATLFLDAIIENIPHMIFLKDAKELRFVRFNRAGEKLLGYDRKDLIGKNDYDFFPKGQADAFTQKDHKVLQSGKLTDIPCEAIDTRENGKRFLHTKKIAIRDAEGKPQFLLGISEDITERMVQEEDLRKYKQAVMSSSDGIIITDPQSIILFVNPAWTHLNGYCAAEVVGKSVSILKTEKTSQKIYANLRKAMHVGEAFHSDDFVNRRKDGSEYNADLTIYPVRKEEEEEEEVLYWVGILADVTSRKTSETAKTEFISLASHQLRTPLSVLRLVIETLLKGIKGPLTADQKNLVVGAGEYAKRMAETINTLLSVSLSDEGKIALSLTDVSIADILKTVQSDSKEECEEKKLACTMQCQKQLMVKTDGKLLTEIVSNLVTNAIRYTPAGGTITLRASANAKAVTIEIEDNGIGIARVDKDKIFSKFFRAENAMKICSDGTGLGLYLVHSFVILLGGTVSVESEEGIGSTFTVILPITPPQPR